MNNHIEHKIPILSFYSGGGFLDMGFEQAGFETVWTNEVDPAFAKLHEYCELARKRVKLIEMQPKLFIVEEPEEVLHPTSCISNGGDCSDI